MQPVCAPLIPAWQSWPPTASPPAPAAASATRVKGGQISTSIDEALAAADAIGSNSAKAALVPFIFQLPATSFRNAMPIPSFRSPSRVARPAGIAKQGATLDAGLSRH